MNFSSYQRRAFLVALIVALGAAASVRMYCTAGFHQLFKSTAIVDALGAAFVVLAGFVAQRLVSSNVCRDPCWSRRVPAIAGIKLGPC